VYQTAAKTNEHCQKKHGEEYNVMKTYPCRVCGKVMTNMRLIKHMEEHRAKGEFEGQFCLAVKRDPTRSSQASDESVESVDV
jgi:hypothetical protein